MVFADFAELIDEKLDALLVSYSYIGSQIKSVQQSSYILGNGVSATLYHFSSEKLKKLQPEDSWKLTKNNIYSCRCDTHLYFSQRIINR